MAQTMDLSSRYINFTVYVKRHIIDEDNDYRITYDFVHSNIEKSYTGTFKDYFDSNSLLSSLGVDGPYRICLDVNEQHTVALCCQMVSLLLDDSLMLNVNQMPYRTAKSDRYIHIVPDNAKWIKEVALNDEQIEQARKLMSEIEEQPFLRPTKKRRTATADTL